MVKDNKIQLVCYLWQSSDHMSINIDWDKDKLFRNVCEQWPNQIQNVSKLCNYIKF